MRRFVRAWSGLLGLLLAASMLLGGTLAWKSLDQTARNDMRKGNGSVFVPVELVKLEKTADGTATETPIPGAEFFLFTAGGAQVGDGPFLTDENGRITVDLEPGEYYFLETYPTFGYDFDLDGGGDPVTKYPFTVEGSEAKVTVTAYNRPAAGTLTVTKEVADHDRPEPTQEQKNLLFTFRVSFDGGKSYPCKIDGDDVQLTPDEHGTLSFRLRHGQTAVFSGIPVGVRYTVTEDPMEGWTTFADRSHGTVVREGQTAAFKNIWHYPEPDEPPVLVVTKVLAGNIPPEDKDKTFHFTLTLRGEKREFDLRPGANGGHDSVTFYDVEFGDAYSIEEAEAEDYILTTEKVTGTVALPRTEAVLTNTHKSRPTVDIGGEKTWTVGPEQRPSSVPIQLWNGDVQVDEVTVTPDGEGQWSYTFTAPKCDWDGKDIEYTVREGAVDGFAAAPLEGGGKYDLVNTPVSPVDADPPIRIRKEVQGQNIPPGQQFRFILRALDGAPLPRTADGVPVAGRPSELRYTLSLNGGGTGEIELGIITFARPGTFVYTVREEKGSEGGWTYDETLYTVTFVVEARDGQLAVLRRTITPEGEDAQPVFHNTYTVPTRPTPGGGGGRDDDDDDDDPRHTPSPKPTAKGTPPPASTAAVTGSPAPTATESMEPSPTPTAGETAAPSPDASPESSLPPQETGTPPPAVPKTGDTHELSLWLAVTASGVLGLLACLGYLFWKKHHYVGKRLMKK